MFCSQSPDKCSGLSVGHSFNAFPSSGTLNMSTVYPYLTYREFLNFFLFTKMQRAAI